MSFSFGAAAAPKPTTSFTGFGSTPAAPSNSSTNLFGSQNTTNAQPSTSLFGAPQQQQQQQPAAQGGGLFGSNNAGTGTSGTTGGGGLFGSANQQPQQQPQQQGGGLFGAAQPQQQQQTGGLFGSTQQQPQQQTGGLFGSTQPPQQQQQQQQQTGGLFGSTQQPQQQQQSGGLFGSTTQNTGGPMFGAGAGGSSMFGQPQPPQQQQQLQQSQQQQHPNGLGQSTLWKSTIGGGVPEQDIETRIMNVKNSWDPSSQEYRFKTFVYNVVDQGTTHQYGRQQGISDELWAMAQRENPDPTTRVPVLVNGPQDLQRRRQKQIEMAAMQQHVSKEISSALRHTRQKAWATDARTRSLQARQTNLHDRLSRLVFQIDQALPPEGSSDASTTADIIQKLEGSKMELDGGTGLAKSRGSGKESLRAQVNTLRGRIAELRRYPMVKQDSADVGWLADPEAQAQVAEILTQHQVALEGLTGLLNNLEFEEGVVAKGLSDMGEPRH